jgi:hypothetical protein
VIEVEGLRSYKAIAFITRKSNPKNKRLKTKTYSTFRTSLQITTTIFLKISFRNTTFNSFNEKLGDEKWKK